MTVEFIGMIHHRKTPEIKSPPPVVFDHAYTRDPRLRPSRRGLWL